jgi:HEAT repeat protein
LGDDTVELWTRALLAEASTLQGDFEAADIAERVLAETDERELRASALRVLAGVGRPDHAPVVRELCRSGDDVVRAQALRALGTVGGPDDVPLLIDAMGDAFEWSALHAARAAISVGGSDALTRMSDSQDPRAALARQVLAEGPPA